MKSELDGDSRRSFLRWAGSKKKLLPRLRKFWTGENQRYVEPFAGSACLFFSLRPNSAILGDSNKDLINVYRILRDEPDALYRRLVRIPRDQASYYRWRAKNPSDLDKQTRALRFIYLNHNCFNGIYRTNAAGQFNVPFGSKLSSYLSHDEFLDCSRSLRKTTLVAGDFQRSLSKVKRGDFVYLDPPYAVTSRRVFKEYGKDTFDVSDVDRLSEELDRLNKLGATFVVSYADCQQARKLAASWSSIKFSVPRHVAGFADHRAKAFEWLISNKQTDRL